MNLESHITSCVNNIFPLQNNFVLLVSYHLLSMYELIAYYMDPPVINNFIIAKVVEIGLDFNEIIKVSWGVNDENQEEQAKH